MPSCPLIYDTSARTGNRTLECQTQKSGHARAQGGLLELQDTRIKYIRSSAKTSPLERRFPPPRIFTDKALPARALTYPLERDPLERRKPA
ncbi:hypothetical protein HYC85_030666 [Camellia sinensis]|uniref:Uncharacterized protein n=1 Tax=Camellia sinensis TaxID=4442 RepID=A0A7J7G2F6_CAMSI|nr:hypothetical protein HYC85_030666 [Camellia sinensis]